MPRTIYIRSDNIPNDQNTVIALTVPIGKKNNQLRIRHVHEGFCTIMDNNVMFFGMETIENIYFIPFFFTKYPIYENYDQLLSR